MSEMEGMSDSIELSGRKKNVADKYTFCLSKAFSYFVWLIFFTGCFQSLIGTMLTWLRSINLGCAGHI